MCNNQVPELTPHQAAGIIRPYVQRLDPHFDFPDEEVSVRDNYVLIGLIGTTLVDFLGEHLFPKAVSGGYYHFTKLQSFREIMQSERLRLYNLHKRINDGEFRLFCEDHRLQGYLESLHDNPNRFVYQELMDDLFYTSLVDATQRDSAHLWQTFGDCCRGVRLGFRVTADNHPDFRKIAYQDNNRLPLFHDLQQEFERFGRDFIVGGLSRFPAYYISSGFRGEFEWRLMIQRVDNVLPFAIHREGAGDVKFIECEMNGRTCPQFQLELIEVTAGTQCDFNEVTGLVRGSAHFAHVPVTRAL